MNIRIVFVSFSYWPPDFGGELIASIERFEFLAKLGFQITVLTSGSEGLSGFETTNGLNIIRCPKIGESKIAHGFRRLVFPFWVVVKILKQHFDILHLSGAGGFGPISGNLGNWLVCKIGKYRHCKIVSVHSLADTEQEMFTEKGQRRWWRKLYLKQCDAIISVSPSLHAGVKKIYPKTAYLILYGVRDDFFVPLDTPEKNEMRRELGLDPQAVVFTFLGTVGYRKGFDILADVFMENSDRYPDWYLWVIGPISKKENQNLNEIETNSLTLLLKHNKDHVKFWGRINNRKQLSRYLSMSDVFIFPSRREGFGIAPLEAMCSGVPVIVSKILGVTDQANIDQVTGLYIEPGNVLSLKTAMFKLAASPELRLRMGAAAVKRIHANFSWQKHVSEWENLYLKLSVEGTRS